MATESQPVSHCRSCGAAIWWGLTKTGKRCPFDYDLVNAIRTDVSHFGTCPQASGWSKRATKQDAA